MTPNIETETHDFIALPPPNGTLIDQWQSPLDWGWFDLPTKISLITGGGPDEHFVAIKQGPDARVFLAEHEIQRVITALSLALTAMQSLDPLADSQEAA